MNIIKPPFSLTLTGHCGSGKSYLIKYIIRSFQQKSFFDFICVFSNTANFTEDYDFLKDKPAEDPSTGTRYAIFSPIYADEKIKRLMQIQKKNRENDNKKNVLIVFDDCFGSVKDSKQFKDLISTYRHYNFSIIFSVQYISGSTTYLREISQYAAIFEQRSANALKLCYESYFQEFEKYTEFKKFFKDKLKKYRFFFINRSDNTKKIMKCP
jgi:ABC-type dipeptide/oligopeptide/nickel transport system ATPase component